MAKKICYQCSTENEEHYSFCKYCGAPLPVVDRAETNSVPTSQRPQATPYDTEYDGISGKELAIYVGKNADKIMPKFFAMQLMGKRTSFCAPVLWLGFFFGFFGMAFWFFARKLYKLGLVLALCGLILAGADIAVNYNAYHTLFTETAQLFAAAVESGANPELLIADYSRLVGNFATAINPIVSNINSYIGGLVMPIIMSFYAFDIYKTKAVREIKRIKSAFPDDGLVLNRINMAGGRADAMVLIPLALNILSSMLIIVTFF